MYMCMYIYIYIYVYANFMHTCIPRAMYGFFSPGYGLHAIHTSTADRLEMDGIGQNVCSGHGIWLNHIYIYIKLLSMYILCIYILSHVQFSVYIYINIYSFICMYMYVCIVVCVYIYIYLYLGRFDHNLTVLPNPGNHWCPWGMHPLEWPNYLG